MATSQFQTSDTPTSTPTNALRNGVASGEDGVHDNPPRHAITDRDGVSDIKSVPEHHTIAAYPTPTVQMKPPIRFDAQDCNSH
ncbi:hypothetical protein N7465_005952 [Penicillium sp. CMV-2018d]|nr:hypothetical protein N7465_005952 [Penicillium sp. CMV-2018d]